MLVWWNTKKVKIIESIYANDLKYKKGLLHIDEVKINFDDEFILGADPEVWVTMLFPRDYQNDGNVIVRVQIFSFDDLIKEFNEWAIKLGADAPIKTFDVETWKFLGDAFGQLVNKIQTNDDLKDEDYKERFANAAKHTIYSIAEKMPFDDYREFMSAFNAAL